MMPAHMHWYTTLAVVEAMAEVAMGVVAMAAVLVVAQEVAMVVRTGMVVAAAVAEVKADT